VYRTITRDKNDKVILREHTKTYNKKTGIDRDKRTFPISPRVYQLLKPLIECSLSNMNNLIFWNFKKNTFITRCQEKGLSLVAIQSLVGHVEENSITNDTYTSISLDFMKKELGKVN